MIPFPIRDQMHAQIAANLDIDRLRWRATLGDLLPRPMAGIALALRRAAFCDAGDGAEAVRGVGLNAGVAVGASQKSSARCWLVDETVVTLR